MLAIEKIFLDTLYTTHEMESLPYLLFANFFKALSLANISYTPKRTTNNKYIDLANQYINMHYSEEISVNTIANYLHISTARLRGLYSQELGFSPQRAIINKRISVAKALMCSEDPPPISEIAEICGYTDQSAFSKRFKKETGLSPLDYIRSIEKQKLV